jgi:hypothetical protein
MSFLDYALNIKILQCNEMGKSVPPTTLASNRQSNPVPMDVDAINKDRPRLRNCPLNRFSGTKNGNASVVAEDTKDVAITQNQAMTSSLT